MACVLILARAQNRTVVLDDMRYLELCMMLRGVVYESSSDAFIAREEWLEEELSFLQPRLGDGLRLSDPLSSVSLLENARKAGVFELTTNGIANAWEVLSSPGGQPPTHEVMHTRIRHVPPDELGPRNDRYFARLDRLLRPLAAPADLLNAFSKVPDGFAESNLHDGYLSSLGAVAAYDADILTGDTRFYRAARRAVRDVFGSDAEGPIPIRRLAKSNAFARAFLAEPDATSVYDVMTVFDDWQRYESIHRLSERIAAQRRFRGEVGVYALAQAATAAYPPLGWIVKLGEFVVRKARMPR